MVDENKEGKELARIAGAIEKLTEAQKKQAGAEQREAKAEEKVAKAEKPKEKKSWFSYTKEIGGAAVGAGAGAIGAAAGMGKEAIKAVSQDAFILIFIIAGIDCWAKYNLGNMALLAHFATFLLLMPFNYGLPKIFLVIAAILDTLHFFLAIDYGIMVIIPWMFTFVVLSFSFDLFFREGIKSLPAFIMYLVIVIFAISIIAPGLMQGRYEQVTAEQQKQIKELKENIVNYWSTVKQYWSDMFMEYQCSMPATQASPACEEFNKKKQQSGPAPIYIDKELPKQFDFGMSAYEKEIFFAKEINTRISAKSLEKPFIMEFSCEIEDFKKGTIANPVVTIQPNTRFNELKKCEFDDVMPAGIKTFVFRTSLKDLQTKATKEINLIDKKNLDEKEEDYLSKNNILSFASITEKNNFLRTVPEYKDYLKKEVKTITSDEFLTIAIQEGDGVTDPKQPSALLNGVDKNTKIPFNLYLQKNKMGDVTKIKDIKIEFLPDILAFENDDNCGYNQAYLNDPLNNWTSLLKLVDYSHPLKSCNLIYKGEKELINPTPVKIVATITYDFEITQKTEVRK